MATGTLRILPDPGRVRAFTLMELLIVIGIIALLAAILFPTFFAARGKARETSCASNLRQIGIGIALYAEDYDDRFPFGGDPSDVHAPDLWSAGRQPVVKTLPPLQDVLHPYVPSRQLWACPSDIGFEFGGASETVPFDTRPSSFDRYGSSYYYRTGLAMDQRPFSAIQAWSHGVSHAERSASDTIYLYDGTGIWHGGYVLNTRRYNSLYVDGHVHTLTRADFQEALSVTFDKPAE